MRKILKPTIGVGIVFKDCIENISDPILKLALSNSVNSIVAAEKDFDDKKQDNELYLIPQGNSIGGLVTTSELKKVYTDRLVNKKHKARLHYNNILHLAPKGKCPLCSQRIAKTLDHYLPKSQYPLLAVSPLNLIPACSDCNKDKLVSFPTTNYEETLHPYYDDLENDSWLRLALLDVNPMIFDFYVDPPAIWNKLLKKRVKKHFDAFNLNELYITHAAEEFENIKKQVTDLYNNGGADSLRSHLLECLTSRELTNKNSWQTALYKGLHNNVRFCNGEFI
ncbi:MAG: hypothetical protein V4543_07705 [Bacteroidota bacterium]